MVGVHGPGAPGDLIVADAAGAVKAFRAAVAFIYATAWGLGRGDGSAAASIRRIIGSLP